MRALHFRGRSVNDPIMKHAPRVSILLPLFNEAENIPLLLAAVRNAMAEAGLAYEVVAVDDGSNDGTWQVLQAHRFAELQCVRLLRNSGQTAAMMAAIDHTKGEVLVPIDGDMQNDPKDIADLVAKLDEGYDVVSGWRADRKDNPIRRNLPSRVANWLISIVSGVRLHDYGCSLKAYRRSALEGIRLYGEMHRFIPIYTYWNGARVTEMPVRHHPRAHGKSKYGLKRIPKVLLDLAVVVFLHRYGQKPMYVFGTAGLLALTASFLCVVAAGYYKFFGNKSFIETPLPTLFAVCFLTGVMCLLMGLLAELLARTYFESQNKRTYHAAPGEPEEIR